MIMTARFTLYHFPGACSRVTRAALEQAGLNYETYIVRLMEPDSRADYLAINPKGKVPALRIGDKLLSENSAILLHLHRYFPDAGLLPFDPGRLGENEAVEDLIWCSATLHPMTRMVRNPARFTRTGDVDGIRALGIEYYQPVLKRLSERFEAGRWWYGDQWSIIDAYLNWNYTTAELGGLDLSPYSALRRHCDDTQAQAALARVLSFEQEELRDMGASLSALPKYD
ncbi:glutathione S-transferase family protein [Rhizorhabdus dicambivorans]|uniref:Glutathione S-transferase family protein n=1 Tax=Rhizorhabdus dicambivorans TaxID=1850238 RepID=A0A2A4FN80_9SPHN|nr:glutathione S-transferase family protein [Rhizorhabdus dicambivorans]ATE65478.1 glutathione S-transferase family protein [Rhizorhabdus dicambivorans]PCE39863.1 glutathione S-transferase family protein [Rhizorhabdus dicambivorans]